MMLAELQEAAKEMGLQPILTTREAAAFARCHDRTIRRWINTGRLSATKSDPRSHGRVLVLRNSLLKLLASGVN